MNPNEQTKPMSQLPMIILTVVITVIVMTTGFWFLMPKPEIRPNNYSEIAAGNEVGNEEKTNSADEDTKEVDLKMQEESYTKNFEIFIDGDEWDINTDKITIVGKAPKSSTINSESAIIVDSNFELSFSLQYEGEYSNYSQISKIENSTIQNLHRVYTTVYSSGWHYTDVVNYESQNRFLAPWGNPYITLNRKTLLLTMCDGKVEICDAIMKTVEISVEEGN